MIIHVFVFVFDIAKVLWEIEITVRKNKADLKEKKNPPKTNKKKENKPKKKRKKPLKHNSLSSCLCLWGLKWF